MFEIQIRTREMHDLAENGIAAHWRYKETAPTSQMKDDRRLHWLREMVALYEEQKNPQEFLKNLKTNLIPEEVYVFTPKGKVISLPPKATALDFAFKIHTEIGLHASEARINGSLVPLKTVLKTGDIVEILTADEAFPLRSWLAAAATSDARHQIKRWLNLKSKARIISLGKKLWGREMLKYDFPPELRREETLLDRLSGILGADIGNMDEIYRLVGLGKIIINREFVEQVLPSGVVSPHKETLLERMASRVGMKPSGKIVIRDGADPTLSLARCCSPIKGEPVIGYVTVGKGITVHSARCALVVKEILDSQRMVEVTWDPSSKGSYKARLLVKAEDSPGVLAKVASTIAQLGGNISKAEVETFAGKNARINLELSIRDIRHLENITDHLAKLKEIISAERA
jgi:GTP pyrophosphokinase